MENYTPRRLFENQIDRFVANSTRPMLKRSTLWRPGRSGTVKLRQYTRKYAAAAPLAISC